MSVAEGDPEGLEARIGGGPANLPASATADVAESLIALTFQINPGVSAEEGLVTEGVTESSEAPGSELDELEAAPSNTKTGSIPSASNSEDNRSSEITILQEATEKYSGELERARASLEVNQDHIQALEYSLEEMVKQGLSGTEKYFKTQSDLGAMRLSIPETEARIDALENRISRLELEITRLQE